jgi:hypothetical protein
MAIPARGHKRNDGADKAMKNNIQYLHEIVDCPKSFAKKNKVTKQQVFLWIQSKYIVINRHAYHRMRPSLIAEDNPIPLIVHIKKHYTTQLAFSYALDVRASQVGRWVANNYIVYKKEMLRYRRELKIA